ncbi:MAG: VOC family protein [Pseudomonadales bacterium]|nr:VOC family protein [Pseudomonadales bacterium]
MSKVFGEIKQLAFVVNDIDKAMSYWANVLGIGPFFIKREITLEQFKYRGAKSPSPILSIALANSGNVQIELIQQHNETPSIFKEFLDSKANGLQHVSSWHTSSELRDKKCELLTKGYKIAQEGVIPSSGVQLVYFSTEDDDGFIFEISDLNEPSHAERIAGIKNSALEWDGSSVCVEVHT